MRPRPVPQRGWRRLPRVQSFLHALEGVRLLVATQPNARIHAAATAAALAAGWWLRLSAAEWAVIILAAALVWLAEGLNTAIEFLVDLVSPEYRKLAGWAKDVAAGAVLLASLGAAVVGLIVFLPKWLRV